ncbi:MAG: hypothetical protein LBT04_03585 [Prevotellaceae bacterium]|jgi:transposase|nr:hypothetical protein [Prevotellaceae bacterium]
MELPFLHFDFEMEKPKRLIVSYSSKRAEKDRHDREKAVENKHDLRMRPVFHWTANRILSHIAVCFVAFSLIRFSAARISEELWSAQESILIDPKKQKRYVLPAKTSKDTQTIYQAMKKTPKFSALSITRKLKNVVARCFCKSLSNSAL